MQTPDLEKTDLSRVVVRNEKFLNLLEEVIKLNWLHGKTQPMDVKSGGYDGNTPLQTACQVGNGEMVMFLLDNGASSQSDDRTMSEDRTMSKDKGPQSGQCPMHSAIKNRHFTVIQLLRWKGFTVNRHPVRITMEMIQAVQKREHPLLQAWSLSGVDMDNKDYNGRTVMHEAVRLQDNTMISKLLEYGATPLASNVTS